MKLKIKRGLPVSKVKFDDKSFDLMKAEDDKNTQVNATHCYKASMLSFLSSESFQNTPISLTAGCLKNL